MSLNFQEGIYNASENPQFLKDYIEDLNYTLEEKLSFLKQILSFLEEQEDQSYLSRIEENFQLQDGTLTNEELMEHNGDSYSILELLSNQIDFLSYDNISRYYTHLKASPTTYSWKESYGQLLKYFRDNFLTSTGDILIDVNGYITRKDLRDANAGANFTEHIEDNSPYVIPFKNLNGIYYLKERNMEQTYSGRTGETRKSDAVLTTLSNSNKLQFTN